MSAEPSLLAFPVDGKVREFHLTAKLLAIHSQAFPSLDVMGEYHKALAWLLSNPARRKTARGMPTFLFRWLSTTQDRKGGNGHSKATNFREEATADAFARARAARGGGEP